MQRAQTDVEATLQAKTVQGNGYTCAFQQSSRDTNKTTKGYLYRSSGESCAPYVRFQPLGGGYPINTVGERMLSLPMKKILTAVIELPPQARFYHSWRGGKKFYVTWYPEARWFRQK